MRACVRAYVCACVYHQVKTEVDDISEQEFEKVEKKLEELRQKSCDLKET